MRLRKRLRHVHARTHTHTPASRLREHTHTAQCIMHQWQKSLSTRSALCARAHTTAFRRRRLRLVLIFVVIGVPTGLLHACVSVCACVHSCGSLRTKFSPPAAASACVYNMVFHGGIWRVWRGRASQARTRIRLRCVHPHLLRGLLQRRRRCRRLRRPIKCL